MTAPCGVFLRSASNDKRYLTAVPPTMEALVSKAKALFPPPPSMDASADPWLTLGHDSSAILDADALPVLRDREILVVRWGPPSSPSGVLKTTRAKNVPKSSGSSESSTSKGVRWASDVEAAARKDPVALYAGNTAAPTTLQRQPAPKRGSAVRAAHVKRVLQQQREQQEAEARQLADEAAERNAEEAEARIRQEAEEKKKVEEIRRADEERERERAEKVEQGKRALEEQEAAVKKAKETAEAVRADTVTASASAASSPVAAPLPAEPPLQRIATPSPVLPSTKSTTPSPPLSPVARATRTEGLPSPFYPTFASQHDGDADCSTTNGSSPLLQLLSDEGVYVSPKRMPSKNITASSPAMPSRASEAELDGDDPSNSSPVSSPSPCRLPRDTTSASTTDGPSPALRRAVPGAPSKSLPGEANSSPSTISSPSDHAAIEKACRIMRNILTALREHPAGASFSGRDSAFTKWCQTNGTLLDLTALGQRVDQCAAAGRPLPLVAFRASLRRLFDGARSFYGSKSAEALNADSVERFAQTLLAEHTRKQRAAAGNSTVVAKGAQLPLRQHLGNTTVAGQGSAIRLKRGRQETLEQKRSGDGAPKRLPIGSSSRTASSRPIADEPSAAFLQALGRPAMQRTPSVESSAALAAPPSPQKAHMEASVTTTSFVSALAMVANDPSPSATRVVDFASDAPSQDGAVERTSPSPLPIQAPSQPLREAASKSNAVRAVQEVISPAEKVLATVQSPPSTERIFPTEQQRIAAPAPAPAIAEPSSPAAEESDTEVESEAPSTPSMFLSPCRSDTSRTSIVLLIPCVTPSRHRQQRDPSPAASADSESESEYEEAKEVPCDDQQGPRKSTRTSRKRRSREVEPSFVAHTPPAKKRPALGSRTHRKSKTGIAAHSPRSSASPAVKRKAGRSRKTASL